MDRSYKRGLKGSTQGSEEGRKCTINEGWKDVNAERSKCIRKDQRMKGRVEESKTGGKYRKKKNLEGFREGRKEGYWEVWNEKVWKEGMKEAQKEGGGGQQKNNKR